MASAPPCEVRRRSRNHWVGESACLETIDAGTVGGNNTVVGNHSCGGVRSSRQRTVHHLRMIGRGPALPKTQRNVSSPGLAETTMIRWFTTTRGRFSWWRHRVPNIVCAYQNRLDAHCAIFGTPMPPYISLPSLLASTPNTLHEIPVLQTVIAPHCLGAISHFFDTWHLNGI